MRKKKKEVKKRKKISKELKDIKKEVKEKIQKNSSKILGNNLTIGQKASDILTRGAGSWSFIILLGLIIAGWIYLNVNAYIKQWDPWPFIILNLCLSCLAAIQAPIILMSQNRTNQRDRLRSEYDYKVNRKAEREIQEIKKAVNRIEGKIKSK